MPQRVEGSIEIEAPVETVYSYWETLENLLHNYAALAPEALESLEPAERHRVYRMLKLRVSVGGDDGIEANGPFGGTLPACELEPSSSSSRR
jgi:hypothetical protein